MNGANLNLENENRMARKTQSEFNRQREIFLLKLMELRREAENMVLDAPEGNTYGKKLHTQAIAQVMRAAEGIFILTPSSIADGLSKVNDLLPQIKRWLVFGLGRRIKMAWDINAFNLAQLIEIKDGPDAAGHSYIDGRHQVPIANFVGENAVENCKSAHDAMKETGVTFVVKTMDNETFDETLFFHHADSNSANEKITARIEARKRVAGENGVRGVNQIARRFDCEIIYVLRGHVRVLEANID